MKKFIISLLLFIFALNMNATYCCEQEIDYKTKAKQDLLVLMLAYPKDIVGLEKTDSDNIYLIMKSGKKILYDDKREKNFNQKLENSDLQDTLEQIYPLDKNNTVMPENFDPGRLRNYSLLSEVYGTSRNVIEKNLTNLKYAYTNYQFNSKNSANIHLDLTLNELLSLSKQNNSISSILYPGSGTYNYRVVSGTNRLSPHSYGIAIDLKSDTRDYWKWSDKNKGEKRINEYPEILVKTFEENYFIWGGKWNHFDILHFEYRPEIILKSKYFNNWQANDDWFNGVPADDSFTKECIDLIDNTI